MAVTTSGYCCLKQQGVRFPHFTTPNILFKNTMGNTASSQPTQNNVQGLVIGETEITTLNFHNTLTYILIPWGL